MAMLKVVSSPEFVKFIKSPSPILSVLQRLNLETPYGTIHRRSFYLKDNGNPSMRVGRTVFQIFYFRFLAEHFGAKKVRCEYLGRMSCKA